jgi:hypothetical protein
LFCKDAVNIIKKIKIETDKGGNTEIKETVKETLLLFMLTFDCKENMKTVFRINRIQGTTVKIEPLRKPNLIPQCKRCQLHGHTQKHCQRQPRCVKCAGKHLTADCKKKTRAKPKCANCNLEHPASYRGCEVTKTFKARRNKLIQDKSKERAEKVPPQVYKQVTTGETYAQSVSNPVQTST